MQTSKMGGSVKLCFRAVHPGALDMFLTLLGSQNGTKRYGCEVY